MADRVTFTKPAAERIGKVVRIVEAGDREAAPYAVDVRMHSDTRGIRFCSWTSTWTYASTATITFDPSTGVTATATNVILGVGPGMGWVARKGTASWCLIGFDYTKQSGYSTHEEQVFGHLEGPLVATWFRRAAIRMATFTGSWQITQDKTVTFKNQGSLPNTANVTNLLISLPEQPGSRTCAVASEGTNWYLVNWQWDVQNAFTAVSLTTSALRFDTLPFGALATASTVTFSVPITTCATATA